MSDISLRDLRNDTSGVLRRAEGGEVLTVLVNRRPVAQIAPLDAADAWVDGAVMERRVRSAQADPGLRDELLELLPDTIGEL